MNPVEKLVDALIDGDSIGIQTAFQSAIGEKISDALDDYRVQVAQSMFNPELELEEETELDESKEGYSTYTGKGNHRPGWGLRADPVLAQKLRDAEKRRQEKSRLLKQGPSKKD